MPFVVYSLQSGKVVSTHATESGAKISVSHAKNRFVRMASKRSGYYKDTKAQARERLAHAKFEGNDLRITDQSTFNEMDVMVTRKNLISGQEFQIRNSDAGGCCDPSTETYWSM